MFGFCFLLHWHGWTRRLGFAFASGRQRIENVISCNWASIAWWTDCDRDTLSCLPVDVGSRYVGVAIRYINNSLFEPKSMHFIVISSDS